MVVMFSQYYWIPVLAVVIAAQSIFVRYSCQQGGKWWYLVIFMGIGATIIWSVITKVSKNLILDGFIFNATIILTVYTTFMLLGVGEKFSVYQWIGSGLALIGLILMIKT